MRITGGSARGQILKTLPGLLVRPTTDKAREAIFSMLSSLAGDWSRVLDLFAGTGALGIEALSREAGYADFVDQNGKCCQILLCLYFNLHKVTSNGYYGLACRR